MTNSAPNTNSEYKWLGGGLWIIPVLTFVGSIIFFRAAYLSSKSDSTTQVRNPDGTSTIIDNTGNVPIYELGLFWFGVICVVATIVVLIGMRRAK